MEVDREMRRGKRRSIKLMEGEKEGGEAYNRENMA